jgi:hypothetical protein
MEGDSLVAKSVKEKCVNSEVKLKVGDIRDLHKI